MRKKVSYTVEETVTQKFNEICKSKAINKSALIEKLMLEFIDDNESVLTDYSDLKEVKE